MSMIICEECGKEISDKATSCTNCGCPIKSKGKINNKKSTTQTLTFCIVIFFIIFILSLGDSNDEQNKVVDITETSKNETVEIDNKNNQNTEVDKSETDNTIEIFSNNTYFLNNMQVTVLDVDLNYTDYEDIYGLYALENGMKYIKIGFQYENQGNDDAYVSIYDYTCYADENLCEQSYYFGGDFINTNLGAGRKVSFEVFFIIPENAQSIELECKPNMFKEEKVILILK